ncbi:MAG TPA: ABC transporter permease [Blastocatellia bacterium]
MRLLDKVLLRIRSPFVRRRVDYELDAELRFHLQPQIEENIGAGLRPDEARRAALLAFGSEAGIKEECRDERGLHLVDEFASDLRFAFRITRKRPGFAAVAILTLGLGIGANTGIFTLINALMLRNLPVRRPGELVLFSDDPRGIELSGAPPDSGDWIKFSYPSYLYFRDHNQSFEALSTFADGIRLTVDEGGSIAAGFATGERVSASYFSLLGVEPVAGRLLTAEDDQTGAAPVCVISEAYWEREFGRDPTAIGRAVSLNKVPVTLIGVAQREFFGEAISSKPADYWVPMNLLAYINDSGISDLEDKGIYWLNILGRLKPGATIEQADAEMNTALRQFCMAELTTYFSGPGRVRDLDHQYLKLVSGARGVSELRAQYSTPLRILMVLVGFVLFIACVNVTGLLLSRAVAREKEISMRMALGAGRSRLMRQMLTESLVLAVFGSGVGLLLSGWSVRMMARLVTSDQTPLNLRPDWHVLIFSSCVCLITAALSGLIPAVRASRIDLLPALSGASTARLGGRFGIGRILVAAQIGISLLLVVGAGLFARTLANLENQNLGFQHDHLVMVRFDSGFAGYKPDQLPGLYHRLLDRVNGLPQVGSATLAAFSPLTGFSITSVKLPGYTPAEGEDMNVWRVWVGPQYFKTLGIPLRAGRGIVPADETGPPVVVLNERAARQFFGNSSAIGRKVSGLGSHSQEMEIVGVAGDVKFADLRDPAPKTVFLPYVHKGGDAVSIDEIEARVSGDPLLAARQIRQAISDLEPHLPITKVYTIDDSIRAKSADMRAIADFSTGFGVLGLVLASVGVYGATAHGVASRTGEIGVRMAIGASRGAVFAMVLRESMIVAAGGVLLGLAGASALGQLVSSWLFGVKPLDPAVLASSSLLLLTVAGAACMLPARRAMNVEPVVALKYE